MDKGVRWQVSIYPYCYVSVAIKFQHLQIVSPQISSTFSHLLRQVGKALSIFNHQLKSAYLILVLKITKKKIKYKSTHSLSIWFFARQIHFTWRHDSFFLIHSVGCEDLHIWKALLIYVKCIHPKVIGCYSQNLSMDICSNKVNNIVISLYWKCLWR